MDGKTRGGKRLQKGVRQPWPMGWAVALLVLVALVYTGVLFNMGRNEAQGAAQGGLQAMEGGAVVTFTHRRLSGPVRAWRAARGHPRNQGACPLDRGRPGAAGPDGLCGG